MQSQYKFTASIDDKMVRKAKKAQEIPDVDSGEESIAKKVPSRYWTDRDGKHT